MVLIAFMVEITIAFLMIRILQKVEVNVAFSIKQNSPIIMGSLFFLVVYCIKYNPPTLALLIDSIVLGYLLGSAMIDSQTLKVYNVFQYPMFVLSFVYFTCLSYQQGTTLSGYIQIGIYLIVIVCMKFFLFGAGDGDVLITISFFLAANAILPIEMLIRHFCICGVVFFVMNVKEINWKTRQLKRRIAFVPSIYIAAMICLYWNTSLYS